jgi:FixJ family two-component response regulator
VQHGATTSDAFSGDGSPWRYHIFLLQTPRASICQNSCVAMTDRPRRSVIAVVDDDPGLLESIESLLNSADYEVRLFSAASALLESGGLPEIDCLISDVAMPLMDGLELARTVQATRPALPVILVTGRPDLLHRSRLDRLRNYRVFKKPFDGQELLTAVALMLRAAGPRAPGS